MRFVVLLTCLIYVCFQQIPCCIKSATPFCAMVSNTTDCVNYLGHSNTGIVQSDSNCTTVTCPVAPTGPCCSPQTLPLPPVMCLQAAAYDCYTSIVINGGAYGGDHQNCSSSTCPAIIGSCITPNKTCINNAYETDCQAMGGFINLGQLCSAPLNNTCTRCPPKIGDSLNQFMVFSSSSSSQILIDTSIVIDGKYGSLNNVSGNLAVWGINQFNGDIAYDTVTDPLHYFHFNDSLATNASADLAVLYEKLKNCTCSYAIPNLINGTVLKPGKHCRTNYLGDALTIVGDIIFDAEGNSDSYFIVYASRSMTIHAMTRFLLKNGAKKENVFILSDGPLFMELAMEAFGTFVAHGDMNTVAVYGDGIKYFSMTGYIRVQVSTILPFIQPPCKESILPSSNTVAIVVVAGTGFIFFMLLIVFVYQWNSGKDEDSFD
jgi:hypothetical protein